MAISELVRVIMARDGLTLAEAGDQVEEAKERVLRGEDPEEVLLNDFGLEPDYVFDLLEA